jgi:disulfide bond formation protein DsbB
MRPAPPPAPAPAPSAPVHGTSFWTWLSLLVGLIGLAGSLWLSMGMDLIACPLCFFQRVFIMGVVGVLLAGIFGGARRAGFVSLVALPLTTAGLGIAGFHVYKEYNGELKCPTGVLCEAYAQIKDEPTCPKEWHEYATPPKESLAIFVLLFLFQSIDVIRSGRWDGFGLSSWLGVVILGGLFTFGLIVSLQNPCDIVKHPDRGCHPTNAQPGGPGQGK